MYILYRLFIFNIAVIEQLINGDSMKNFKLLTVCFALLFMLVGCDVKTDNPIIISDSSNTVKPNNNNNNNNTNTDKSRNNVIRFDGVKNKVFPCLDRDFSVDGMIVDDNKILLHVTNVSTEKIATLRLSEIQLRPIKDGKPTTIRSKITSAKVVGDRLVPFELFDDIYPGESAVVKQEMPSAFTKCEDYSLAYDDMYCRYKESPHVLLNKIIDCTNTK